MARPKRKLQKSDINRNTSIEVSHTIKKIKENERKYTVILVIIFMSIFSIIGYKVFSINSDVLIENVKAYSYFSASLEKITLTNKDIYNDEEGLKTKKHVLSLTNNTNIDKEYKVYFIEDENNTINNIKYSFNQKDILKLGEGNLFTEGTIRKGESINISYNIWIDNKDIDLDKDYQIKGHFIVKEK